MTRVNRETRKSSQTEQKKRGIKEGRKGGGKKKRGELFTFPPGKESRRRDVRRGVLTPIDGPSGKRPDLAGGQGLAQNADL